MNGWTRRGFVAGLGLLALAPGMAAAQQRPAARPAGFDPDALIAAAGLGGAVAYAVIDPASGQVLAERGADRPMAPASTLKAVTALYALDRLGEGHRFATRVIRAGNTLILAGGGDPVLDTDALDELAAAAVADEQAAGRPAPTAFAVWGGALPRIGRLDPAQDVHLPYNPSISGMMLNFNRVHLDWRQGEQGYRLSLQARGRKLSPRAYTASIAAVDRGLPLFTYEAGKLESWTIARRSLGKAGSRWLPVRRPELYAGDVFQTLCRARGLALPKPEVIEILPEGAEIARHDSPDLRRIVRDMLEYSTNLTAEAIGLAASGAGDVAASAAAMADWLRAQGVGGDFAFHDHSGLSAQNRVSAGMLARLMAGPGQTRDLRALMKLIPLRDAAGKRKDSATAIKAKTGTLNFVSNLAGYAQGAAGRELAFAILTADEPRRAASEGRELPQGVMAWTKRSKRLQQALIEGWLAEYTAPAPLAAVEGVGP
ncbi:D-alanyl-D-alanine carboxypeptidase / D-alanyl-D-alanine-endopeptidase (penicillin-binding protein 4) [Paracoccus thiocyanatus]|uniref:D-alanyl-D-alanine carboxypeptidase / D-alanyl-D-alanine-endopeptidase (Penicillin-binding protein 4) n=1 Tax=Paracoccus thiocyanatus TaxID=34006 RepID=A0A1N6SV66_9RHOB|nr:D-alanyl-D-alanine carboxypeptidase [Paracoccus thiocyanatus]SIQ44951.1 D-alanyl-D-alanine carboxypeptidase / D-alanyl-D-alanine-endopeptidase (penicillin-binding protein 4) [Paracoccus thiocyanatus]